MISPYVFLSQDISQAPLCFVLGSVPLSPIHGGAAGGAPSPACRGPWDHPARFPHGTAINTLQSCSRALHCRVDSSHGSLWALVCDTKALMSCLHRSPVFCGSPPCAPTRSASNPGPGRCVRFSRPWREQSSRVRSSHVWPWARGRASSRCAGRALEVCKGHTGSVLGARCRLACRCHCTAGSSAGSAGPRVLRRAHWDTCVRETVWGVAEGTMGRERNEIPGNSMSLLYWLC